MPELPITSALAGAAAIMLVLLSLPVANHRRKNKLGTGDGGDERFLWKIRAHANFTEYTPIGLIAIGLVEAAGRPTLETCSLAAILGAGRVLHAIGMGNNIIPARFLGMILTFTALLGAGAILLARTLGAL